MLDNMLRILGESLDGNRDALLVLDRNGHLVYGNRKALDLHGLTRDKFGRRVQDVLPPAVASSIWPHIQKAMDEGNPLVFEAFYPSHQEWHEAYCHPSADGWVVQFRDITHHKRRESALAESDIRFRSIFGNVAVGTAIVSPEGRFLQVNGAFCDFLGYSERELLDKTILDVTQAEDREDSARAVREAHASGAPIHRFEKRYLRRDGRVVWGEVSVALVRNAQGHILYSIAQVLDISERKQAHQTLLDSHATLFDIVNRSQTMAFRWRVVEGWPVEYASETVSQLGYTADDFMSGRVSWPAITHPEDVPRLEAEVAAYLAAGRTEFSQQYRLFSKSGEIRHVEDRNAVIKDAEGVITHIQGVVLDVTERVRTEEKLREMEALHRRLFETSMDGILLFDAESRKAVDVNAAWRRLYGYDGQDISTLDLMTLSTQPEESAAALQSVVNGGIVRIPLRYHKRRDGKVFPVELTAGSLAVGARRVVCVTTRDISERLRAEEALRKSYDELEQRVDERTKELVKANEALQLEMEARVRAQREVDEQKLLAHLQRMEALAMTGRLAAGIAHEVNNPLQGILAQVRLLSDELPVSARSSRRIQLIQDSVQRISEVVTGLLRLHRPVQRDESRCTAKPVIGNVADLLKPLGLKQGVRVEVIGPDAEMTVPLSGAALTQVLMNLALNALDAMPEGGVLTLEASEDPVETRIGVSDTGSGVLPEHRQQIFTPFFTTKGPQGTGLGLSVTHALVTSAGGTIDLVDREGRGTTFLIRFAGKPVQA